MEFYGGMNCLKAGITYADVITTVSPRYAREITTEQYGCGLDGVLRQRQDALVGILNGVDYDEWTTVGNPYLSHSYTADDLRGKAPTKPNCRRNWACRSGPEVPLFGTVARLADQKGVDIQLGALEEMLAADMQFILLGSGGREFERGYRKLALRYPGKCAVKIGFDTTLSHRIESACDFFLMPSLFEPCGLNQLYSLRYGTDPHRPRHRRPGRFGDRCDRRRRQGRRHQVPRILRARPGQGHPQSPGALRGQGIARSLSPQRHGQGFLLEPHRRRLRTGVPPSPPLAPAGNGPIIAGVGVGLAPFFDWEFSGEQTHALRMK